MRARLFRFLAASICAVASSFAHLAIAATVTFDGGPSGTGTALDNNLNWLGDVLPGTGDEVLFNAVPPGPANVTTTPASPTYGNLIWNQNNSSSITINTGTTNNRTITLSGLGGSTEAVAAGGTAGDLLLMGTNATTNTLTVGGNVGAGTGRLSLALATSGGFNVVSVGATLHVTADISGVGLGITKRGAGSMVFAGANSYTGATNVDQGTLTLTRVGDGSTNGNINGGANTNTQLTTSSLNIATGATTVFNTGGGSNFSSANSGTTITGGGTLRLQSGTWWLGNPVGGTTISMAAGGLIDVQSGATMKNDYNTANWSTNQASLNVAAGGSFNLRNNNVWVDALTGGGAVFNDFATNTLTVGVAGGSGTFSGTIGPGGTSMHLTKTGAGTQILTGNNTYTGTTTISGGILQIGNGSATGTLGTGPVVNSASLVFNRSNAYTFAGGISGAGTVTQNGSGTTTLSGAGVTYSGATTINNGALTLQDTTGFASTTTVNSATTLNLVKTVNGFGARSKVSGLITGSGTLNINNATSSIIGGWITFNSASSGLSNFTGVINVNSGVLSMDNIAGAWSGNPDVNVFAGGLLAIRAQNISIDSLNGDGDIFNSWNGHGAVGDTLTVGANNGSGLFSGVIHGSTLGAADGSIEQGFLNLVKAGAGTQTLTGNNTYAGTTTISGGVLQIGNGGTTGTLGTGNATNNASLVFNRSNTYNVAGGISGNGTVTQNGSGATTLSGAGVNYSGATTINNGGLTLQDTTGFASTTTVNSGTTLNLVKSVNGFGARSKVSGLITGSGTLNINNATSGINGGWITFNSANSGLSNFTGVINVNSGVLSMDNIAGAWSGNPNVNIVAGGLLAIRAQSISIDALDGNGDVMNSWNGHGAAGNTLTVGANNGTGTFSGVIHGSVATGGIDGTIEQGILNLVKAGNGTQTLGGANTYAGATRVEDGTLEIGTGGSIAGTSSVTVGVGAGTDTLLLTNPAAHTLGTGDLTVGSTGVGVVNHNAGNATVGNANVDAVRIGVGAQGTYHINNGAISTLSVGTLGARGNLIVGQSNVGGLNVGANATVNVGDLIVGQLPGSSGIVNQTGGTINVTNPTTYTVGGAGSGLVNHSGGTSNVTGHMNIGTSSGTGIYNLSGPVASSMLQFGDFSPVTQTQAANPSTLTVGPNGTFNFTGGTLANVRDIVVTSGPFVQDGGRFVIGVDGGLDPLNALTTRAMTEIRGGDFVQLGGTLEADIFGGVIRSIGGESIGPIGPAYNPINGLITDSDLLHIVDNDATLNGTLEIDLNNFKPLSWAWYDVVVADSISIGDDFDLQGIDLWRVIDDPSDPSRQILQVAIPEPASWALWGLAAIIGLFAARRLRRAPA